MGNHAGIVSGFFTALVHAVLALVVLFFASVGDGPYVDAFIFASVIVLVCCIGLVARSHFSAVLLLLLDLLLIGLAVAWCVSIILVFQSPPPLEPDSWAITESFEQVSRIARLVASGIAILLSLWLAMRTLRLEQRLRRVARISDPGSSR